jgi:hypothetical protein
LKSGFNRTEVCSCSDCQNEPQVIDEEDDSDSHDDEDEDDYDDGENMFVL